MRYAANLFIHPISSSIAISADHTIRRSVIVLTIHPTPATSVNYSANSLTSVSHTPEMIRKGEGRTFSCHPNNTLPLTSPQPGRAIPLYKYFIRVSCVSGGSDLTTLGMSVDLVLLRIVTRVCSVRFCNHVQIFMVYHEAYD